MTCQVLAVEKLVYVYRGKLSRRACTSHRIIQRMSQGSSKGLWILSKIGAFKITHVTATFQVTHM